MALVYVYQKLSPNVNTEDPPPTQSVEDIPKTKRTRYEAFASTAGTHQEANNAGPNLTHNTQADLPEKEERESVMERHDVSQNNKKQHSNTKKLVESTSGKQNSKQRKREDEKSIKKAKDEETESRFGVLGQE